MSCNKKIHIFNKALNFLMMCSSFRNVIMNNLDFMINRSDQYTPKLNSAQIPTNTKFQFSSFG
jgi:hypothetical protein